MSTLALVVHLPELKVNVAGREVDLSVTKHMVMLLLASTICAMVLIGAARSQASRARVGKPPRGFANAMEGMVLYLRSEVVLANVGPHGEKYVSYLLSLFFFILFGNMLGLMPYGATFTSNISVTATLAVIAFFVVEISGMISMGPRGYMSTVIFWPHDGSLPMKLLLSLIISPIEFLGKFTKPFALAIRLFANMTAGHIIVLAFIGMIFTFQSYFVAIPAYLMAVAIMLLEVLVALLQAYIFTLLVSVFIGQVRSGAH
jgi:F-type H+-transporting ATPase subunit a